MRAGWFRVQMILSLVRIGYLAEHLESLERKRVIFPASVGVMLVLRARKVVYLRRVGPTFNLSH